MKSQTRIVFIMVMLLMFASFAVRAFDIAVYHDTRSAINWRCENPNHLFCGGSRNQQTVLGFVTRAREQQVFDWFDSMGVTYLITQYPFSVDFVDLHSFNLGNMKILNGSWPGAAVRYLESQNREVFAGRRGTYYVYRDGSSWEPPATDIDWGANDHILQIQSPNAGMMWRPQSDLGIWQGWKWRESQIIDSIYMPYYFRLTCNLGKVGNPPDTQAVATFYWFVADCGDGNGDGKPDCWWRYPGHILRVGDFADSSTLDIKEFTIDPHPGASGTFQKVDANFQPITDSTKNSHSFGNVSDSWGSPVRMCIYYHGHNQIFQVYKVDAWDEGYDRMFVRHDSCHWDTVIAQAFVNEFNSANGKMAGWYHDEWQQWEMTRGCVKVQKNLHDFGLPLMITNYHWGDEDARFNPMKRYVDGLAAFGLVNPIHMNECYFQKDGVGCQPRGSGGITPEVLYTDSLSDSEYLHAEHDGCGTLYSPWSDSLQPQYTGHRSLQCAIDGVIFGNGPLYQLATPAPISFIPYGSEDAIPRWNILLFPVSAFGTKGSVVLVEGLGM